MRLCDWPKGRREGLGGTGRRERARCRALRALTETKPWLGAVAAAVAAACAGHKC